VREPCDPLRITYSRPPLHTKLRYIRPIHVFRSWVLLKTIIKTWNKNHPPHHRGPTLARGGVAATFVVSTTPDELTTVRCSRSSAEFRNVL